MILEKGIGDNYGFRPLAGIRVLNIFFSFKFGDLPWSFRPLAGIRVLNKESDKCLVEIQRSVSVPLRGLGFLTSGNPKKLFMIFCFRPLTGIRVLNNLIAQLTPEVFRFPSPYGD